MFQHAVNVDFAGIGHRCSDNFFDLYPGEAKQVQIEFDGPVDKAEIVGSLRCHSLAHTYE